jgi:ABC-type nitrate/sulfonate/bicarbonate transport system ATPase subunit/ABC-type transporter Mla maintaining outer membrane lipid asymmetry permease subunit MlaE
VPTPPNLLSVRALTVTLPDGTVVLDSADLELAEGRVVCLLGPSGSGKTTVVRAIFAPERLRRRGYSVSFEHREMTALPAFVPQRGALIDHLDVVGNIELAQAGGGGSRDAAPWLKEVELEGPVARRGRAVSALSGGQAQRVAVARTLAAGRRLLVLDEPSVGLDSLSVRLLARLLLRQAREHRAAILLITHDLSLAAALSDEILFLSPSERRLVAVLPGWSGPVELLPEPERASRQAALTAAVEALLLAQEQPVVPHGSGTPRAAGGGDMGALAVLGASIVRAFDPRLFRESSVVFARTLVQSLLRPLLFYAIVGVLLGFTVPYVVVHISEGLRPSAVLGLIGGSYVLSLAPPLSAIVFAATSGSAVSAWLGGLRLNGQVEALEGLGIAPARYLWSPAWLSLVLSYLVTAVLFVASMIAGGWALFTLYDVPHALSKLSADFLDPAPERQAFLVRGAWLVGLYALSIASIVVAKGEEHKDRSDEVTAAMTSATVRLTLLVVTAELASIALLFALTGRHR